MENVYQKAEELGKAILQSQAYSEMNIAEQAAMDNDQVQNLAQDRNDARQKVQDLLQTPQVDRAALEEASAALKVAEEALQALPMMIALEEKQQAFANMMNDVNKLIQYALTGEMPQESGCGGNCGSCGGC